MSFSVFLIEALWLICARCSVRSEWAANYSGFAAKFGSDFAAALTKPSGKWDGAGNAMFVWQDYVAGTDPTGCV